MATLFTILMILQENCLPMSNGFSLSGPLKNRARQLMALTRLWQIALIVSMIIILLLSTAHIDGPTPMTGWDKLNHLIAFMELIVLARLGWPAQSRLGAGLAVLAFGLFVELVQAPLAHRSFSLLDIMADGAGVLVGLWVVQRIALLLQPEA
jgi:VanZ family protein